MQLIYSNTHGTDPEKRIIRPTCSMCYCGRGKVSDSERSAISNLIAMDVIERTRTEQAPVAVFPKREDVTLRFCNDYKAFDAVIARFLYPFSQVDKEVDPFKNLQVFSNMDVNINDWLIRVGHFHKYKNCSLQHGLQHYIRMLSGWERLAAFKYII